MAKRSRQALSPDDPETKQLLLQRQRQNARKRQQRYRSSTKGRAVREWNVFLESFLAPNGKVRCLPPESTKNTFTGAFWAVAKNLNCSFNNYATANVVERSDFLACEFLVSRSAVWISLAMDLADQPALSVAAVKYTLPTSILFWFMGLDSKLSVSDSLQLAKLDSWDVQPLKGTTFSGYDLVSSFRTWFYSIEDQLLSNRLRYGRGAAYAGDPNEFLRVFLNNNGVQRLTPSNMPELLRVPKGSHFKVFGGRNEKKIEPKLTFTIAFRTAEGKEFWQFEKVKFKNF